MTQDFLIGFEPYSGGSTEMRRLSVRLGGSSLTRLIRGGSSQPDDCLEAPPLPLAFWLVDNWWRIRWEPAVPDNDHVLADL